MTVKIMTDSIKYVIYLLVVFLIHKTSSENPFKSVPVTVKTYENETVLLPCYVDDTESCITPEGSNGTCIPLLQCPPLNKLIQPSKISTKDVDLLRSSSCGFDGKIPKVCCPYVCLTPSGEQGKCVSKVNSCPHLCKKCEVKRCYDSVSICCPFLNENEAVSACQSKVSAFPPNKMTKCCGRDSSWDDKITGAGGTETSLDKYPWLALIEYQKLGRIGTFCGGVLISGKYVLTAAHCVTGSIVESGTPISVRLGEHDTSTKIDCRPVAAGGTDCNEEPLSLSIETTIPHPQYNPQTRKHDIALIRLKELAPYTDFIRPICLPTSDITLNPPDNYLKFYVAGWGKVNSTLLQSPFKVHVDVPLVDKEKCQKVYSVATRNATLWRGQVCAGGEVGKDACKGDSGGPLMYEGSQTTDVIGVVSFGTKQCGTQDVPESRLRVRWYKDTTLLGDSMDAHHLLPPRVRMHANYSLQVDSLVAGDTADYTCEVIRPEPWGPIRQTHSIEVQYSPTVRTIPEDGFLEARKGEYVDIGCEASGTPTPIITWKKNGESMALLEPRSRLRFKAEHRLLAGVYECSANNGVGDPVTAAIRVVVLDAPVVSALRSFVHTAAGLRAALAARLEFAVPPARTAWYREGRPVKTDDRVVIMVQDNVHQLIFRTVRKTDLGNYTFRAENKLGMADVQFKLTGVPNIASFKVDQALNKPTPVSFTLVWEVDSYSTIIEYNLWIRPYYGRLSSEADSFTTEAPSNHWVKIVVPGDSSEGPIHSAVYTVRGLTPSTVYEAIVTSRNRFGWSKPSAILHFATEPGAGRQIPSTSDYTDVSPVLEELEPEAHNISQAQVFERVGESSSGAREISSAILISIVILLFCIS